jgi:transposase-like protein
VRQIRGVPWTAEEDEALRHAYATATIRWTVDTSAPVLASRTAGAVRQRAHKLGLRLRVRWTEREDRLLTFAWGTASISEIAKRMGRTVPGVAARAVGLGLHGDPDKETLSAAAERCGVSTGTMLSILSHQRVHMHRVPTAGMDGGRGRTRLYDREDVDEAFATWLRTETPVQAAARVGVEKKALRKWLREAGVLPPPSQAKRRVDKAEVDRVIAERMKLESIAFAAKRIGVAASTLGMWLAKHGVAKHSRQIALLPPSVFDDVAAKEMSKPSCRAPARRRVADRSAA